MLSDSVSGSGIVNAHAYTVLGTFTLSNGAQVIKLRNPWGFTEWAGNYADSDPYWTANPADAILVGTNNGNDGIFVMEAASVKSKF